MRAALLFRAEIGRSSRRSSINRKNWKVGSQDLSIRPYRSDRVSCPNSDAIACVLLQSIGSDEGPSGGKLLTQTTFIQRLNTRGGLTPADGCFVSTDVGNQALVPYSADYFFFRKNE